MDPTVSGSGRVERGRADQTWGEELSRCVLGCGLEKKREGGKEADRVGGERKRGREGLSWVKKKRKGRKEKIT